MANIMSNLDRTAINFYDKKKSQKVCENKPSNKIFTHKKNYYYLRGQVRFWGISPKLDTISWISNVLSKSMMRNKGSHISIAKEFSREWTLGISPKQT